MIDISHAQELIGSDVYDAQGDKIGKVGSVYVNDETRKPEWVTVRTGLFGTKETFVPLSGAKATEQGVRVPVTKDKVKDAPQVGAEGGHMSEQEGRDLYRYYGLGPARSRDDSAKSDTASHPPKAGAPNTGGAKTAAPTAVAPSADAPDAQAAPAGPAAARPSSTVPAQGVAGRETAAPSGTGPSGTGPNGIAPNGQPATAKPTAEAARRDLTSSAADQAMPGTPSSAAATPATPPHTLQPAGQQPASVGPATAAAERSEPRAASEPAGAAAPAESRAATPSNGGAQSAGGPVMPGTRTMTRCEEHLVVSTERVASGHVRMRKYVVTEEEQIRVSLSHEEIRIERRPITEAERSSAMRDAQIGEQNEEIVLHAERPVVTKKTVPVETVHMHTEMVTNEQVITGEVRKERIDVEDGAQRTAQDASRTEQDTEQDAGPAARRPAPPEPQTTATATRPESAGAAADPSPRTGSPSQRTDVPAQSGAAGEQVAIPIQTPGAPSRAPAESTPAQPAAAPTHRPGGPARSSGGSAQYTGASTDQSTPEVDHSGPQIQHSGAGVNGPRVS